MLHCAAQDPHTLPRKNLQTSVGGSRPSSTAYLVRKKMVTNEMAAMASIFSRSLPVTQAAAVAHSHGWAVGLQRVTTEQAGQGREGSK